MPIGQSGSQIVGDVRADDLELRLIASRPYNFLHALGEWDLRQLIAVRRNR